MGTLKPCSRCNRDRPEAEALCNPCLLPAVCRKIRFGLAAEQTELKEGILQKINPKNLLNLILYLLQPKPKL